MNPQALGKLAGVAITAGLIGWGTYLWAGAQRSDQALNQVALLRVELQGKLERLGDEQARMRQDIQDLTRALEQQNRRDRDRDRDREAQR